ncbi:hypothetical protein HOD83_00415 [Candidatus Woesearchaeota archaeon]|jgi:hypothetical protein|nr:hypothetical protein [Candidatus Woesearchaeota archaeon]MBT4248040.1 hypothetical protein [Candidatus Woesearchaeota archaeon]
MTRKGVSAVLGALLISALVFALFLYIYFGNFGNLVDVWKDESAKANLGAIQHIELAEGFLNKRGQSLEIFANHYKETQTVSAEDISCGGFIDYDVSSCPFLGTNCIGEPSREACVTLLATDEGISDEAYVKKHCQYESFCDEHDNDKIESVEHTLVAKRYLSLQITQMIERCIYINKDADLGDVVDLYQPCFSFEYDSDIPITYADLMQTVEYTESFYSDDHLVHDMLIIGSRELDDIHMYTTSLERSVSGTDEQNDDWYMINYWHDDCDPYDSQAVLIDKAMYKGYTFVYC